jgi:(p)ppGpp synthase/HD superfamily hydrolase
MLSRHLIKGPPTTVIRVADALSRTQIDKLGKRLAERSYLPTTEDLMLLERFRAAHSVSLQEAAETLRSLGLQPTSRPKTTGTIIDKLRREGAMRLSQMEDIAGLRVVMEMTRDTQDELVQKIVAAMPNGTKTKDRRPNPSHGYRAVHLVARVADHQVEIQLRTTRSRFRCGRGFRISGRRWSSDSPTPGDARSGTGSARITLEW